MDEQLVKKAKQYASRQNKSLSGMITDLLQKQTALIDGKQQRKNPFLELAGILDYEALKNSKDDRTQYLLSKHD